VSVVSRRQCPKNDDHDEKASEMDQSQETLNQRESPRHKDVDEDAEAYNRDRQECSVPSFPSVVGVLESDETLNGAGYDRSNRGDGGLPAGESEPANDVRQEAFYADWRKLADPVVLSAGCWGPVIAESISIAILLNILTLGATNMEAISDRLKYTTVHPSSTKRKPQNMPAVPPFTRIRPMLVRSTSQVQIKVEPKPRMVIKVKTRRVSWILPSRLIWALSPSVPRYLAETCDFAPSCIG
jgi:hypothetical protein